MKSPKKDAAGKKDKKNKLARPSIDEMLSILQDDVHDIDEMELLQDSGETQTQSAEAIEAQDKNVVDFVDDSAAASSDEFSDGASGGGHASGSDKYEEVLDHFLLDLEDVARKTKPTDEFLRRNDPVLFYKRKVNETWDAKKCFFCETTHMSDLHFTNVPLLSLFVSEAGNILPKRVSQVCSKHQRKGARTIKHSRHTGLLPFHGNLYGRLPLSGHEPDAEPTPIDETD